MIDRKIRGAAPLMVIVGPTAVGKTAVAVRIAEALGGEIVSADSRQIYLGMRIGSGAPSDEELNRVRHHLVGVVEPDTRLSAGEFARMAQVAIDDIRSRGKMPLIVGGSGLYVKALVNGLAPVPPANAELREQLEREISTRGYETLQRELVAVDPQYAKLVGPRNRKRLVRALEVYRLTGKPFSDWHGSCSESGTPAIMFCLSRPRAELHRLIEQRIYAMFATGWINEVEQLAEKYGGLDALPAPVAESVGYRQIVAHLKGEIPTQEMKLRTLFATRQFAKRQLTWFRADSKVIWLEETGLDAIRCWTDCILEKFGN